VNDQTDSQLLRSYVEQHSEAAFAELVRRHVDLVYSAALRMVCDSHLAEDVAQSVFMALAKNAAQLTNRAVLSGWLHGTAQNIAAQTVRSEVRRRAREREAATMDEMLATESNELWEDIAPHLDAALGQLNEADRDALLLRYFERKSAQDMARILGISEEAAQKRVSRAVERLREFFTERGVTVGAGGLVVAISANAVQSVPPGLSVGIAAASLAATTTGTTATAIVGKAITMTTLQKALIGTTLVVAVGTGMYEARKVSALRRAHGEMMRQQQAPLSQKIEQLTRERDAARRELGALRDENERLNRNTTELLRLRGEAAVLRRQQGEVLKQSPAKGPPPAEQKPVDAIWVRQVLDSSPRDQGAAAGSLRGKLLRSEIKNISPSELALRDALLQRQLNQSLEPSPAAFGDFQAAFIQNALAIADGTRVQAMRDLIQKTYEQAVASGLDIPSKPTTDTETWVQRRFQLDRQATVHLKELLAPEEVALFDRAFLGVMGIDLGGIGVDKSNYPRGFLGPE